MPINNNYSDVSRVPIYNNNNDGDTSLVPTSLSSKPPVGGKTQEQSISRDYSKALNYVSKNNPNISNEEALKRFENGAKIAESLLSGKEEKPTHEGCRDLCWFLTGAAFEQEGEFARGVIRVTNSNSETIFNYLKNADNSYKRPSSHFKEMSVGDQIGHDFKKGDLHDAALGTMLTMKLNDGSVGIKFEREGLNISNPISAAIHMKNWALHSISGGGKKEINGSVTRRETDGQEKVGEAFNKVLNAIKTNNSKILTDEEFKNISGATRTFERFEAVQIIKSKISEQSHYVPEKPQVTTKDRMAALRETSVSNKRLSIMLENPQVDNNSKTSSSQKKTEDGSLRKDLARTGASMLREKSTSMKRLSSLTDTEITQRQRSNTIISPLNQALREFDNATKDINQPDKISGNEVLLELKFPSNKS